MDKIQLLEMKAKSNRLEAEAYALRAKISGIEGKNISALYWSFLAYGRFAEADRYYNLIKEELENGSP